VSFELSLVTFVVKKNQPRLVPILRERTRRDARCTHSDITPIGNWKTGLSILQLPVGSLFGILDLEAHFSQSVTNLIRGGPVFLYFGFLAKGKQ
jgi:hypothetical protein